MGWPAGAHLQAVGLHQVEWAQQAVEAGEHAQVILGVAEVVFTEAFGVEAGVYVTFEREQRLFGIVWGEVCAPAAKACGVEAGEFVREVHQLADLCRAQVAQLADQRLRVIQILRQGETLGHRRGVVVEGFGGGNHRQHRVGSCNRMGRFYGLNRASPNYADDSHRTSTRAAL